MFCLNDAMQYFLCPGRIDMRKGISSLCDVVHERMGCSVKNGDVFIFYVASFISLCQGTATSGNINHIHVRKTLCYRIQVANAF
ncbi:IS66 family insertion sequence element accessory protein TnpB [Bacteroides caccae]|nr:IS66 family insertion sequence element accessory protein TnpB [Bacteroides caccae]